jgi:hypothetical protein
VAYSVRLLRLTMSNYYSRGCGGSLGWGCGGSVGDVVAHLAGDVVAQ